LRGVALRAGFRIQRRPLMDAVAGSAGLIGVQAHRSGGVLRLLVAPQARRRRMVVLAERVAVLARGDRRASVERRGDSWMAALAQRRGRPLEAVIAVAISARNLADMRGVA